MTSTVKLVCPTCSQQFEVSNKAVRAHKGTYYVISPKGISCTKCGRTIPQDEQLSKNNDF